MSDHNMFWVVCKVLPTKKSKKPNKGLPLREWIVVCGNERGTNEVAVARYDDPEDAEDHCARLNEANRGPIPRGPFLVATRIEDQHNYYAVVLDGKLDSVFTSKSQKQMVELALKLNAVVEDLEEEEDE